MSAWTDLQSAIAKRLGEPDIMVLPVPVGEPDIPYFTADMIERKLLEISNQKLREVPYEELESINSPALVTTTSVASGTALTAGTVKIVSVSIKPSNTSVNYVPTDEKEPAAFFQTITVDPNISTSWTVYSGALQFTGFEAKTVTIIEQPLSVWQTTSILPIAYDEERIDWVVKQLLISDWVPIGMV